MNQVPIHKHTPSGINTLAEDAALIAAFVARPRRLARFSDSAGLWRFRNRAHFRRITFLSSEPRFLVSALSGFVGLDGKPRTGISVDAGCFLRACDAPRAVLTGVPR